jgi:hypothetical protein
MRRDLPDGARYRLLDNRFVVRYGEWMRCGEAHLSGFYGQAVLYMLILLVLAFISYQMFLFGPLVFLLLLPGFEAGFSYVALKHLTGRRWEFTDFFGGFRFVWRIEVINVLQGLLVLIFFLPGYGMLVFADIVRGPTELYAVGYGVLLFCLVPGYYLQTRCFLFATQLILDRHYGPIEAILGSWHLTAHATTRLLIARFLLLLIPGFGFLGCGIGAVFTFPLMYLTWNAGYLLIAGRDPPSHYPESRTSGRGVEEQNQPPRSAIPLPEDYGRAFRDRR